MKKGLKLGFSVFAGLLVALALWFFRPWSDYSPYKIVAFQSSHNDAQWFANFHKVLPNRRIAPSDSPRQWPRAPQDMNISYAWEGAQKTLSDYMAQTGVTGFMVLQDVAIAFEHHANGSTPETRNMIWSVAKSYTVTILGLALKEGVIKSLDDTVETYAPQFKGTAYGETSIRHITMMSSGINFGPNNKWGPISLWAKTYFDLTMRQFWIPQDYDGEFMALGGFDQVVWIDLKRNAVIAQTAAGSRHGGVSPLEQFKVFRALIAASSAGAKLQKPATTSETL